MRRFTSENLRVYYLWITNVCVTKFNLLNRYRLAPTKVLFGYTETASQCLFCPPLHFQGTDQIIFSHLLFLEIPPSRGCKAVQMPHYRSIPGDQMPSPPGNFSVASVMLRKLCNASVNSSSAHALPSPRALAYFFKK